VSLQPSATVILAAIGKLDRVVACTKYCVDVCPEIAHYGATIVADSWTASTDQIVIAQPDLVIAAVVGEIEKSQWGEEFRGREYRGYATGSRALPTHGGIADMCILGEPTEQRVVLAHFGTMWARISAAGRK